MKDLAALISAIAALLWPVVVFVLVYLFRSELRSLLGRIRKGKMLGQELEFADAVGRNAETLASFAVVSASRLNLGTALAAPVAPPAPPAVASPGSPSDASPPSNNPILERLAAKYDSEVKGPMFGREDDPAGAASAQEMLRELGVQPLAQPMEWLTSPSPGKRLAAYLQMYGTPGRQNVKPLAVAVNRESIPFLQYWGLQALIRTIPLGSIRYRTFANEQLRSLLPVIDEHSARGIALRSLLRLAAVPDVIDGGEF